MKKNSMALRYLFTEPDAPGDPVRALIRENKIGALATYIDRAAAKMTAQASAIREREDELLRLRAEEERLVRQMSGLGAQRKSPIST